MTVVLDKGHAFWVLEGISWETYVALSDDLAESRWPRLTYDEGRLELMWFPPAEEKDVVLVMENISWKTYNLLLADLEDRPFPRMVYDHGALQMMSPGMEHEGYKVVIRKLIEWWTFHHRVPLVGSGSTTLRRATLKKGLDPDEGYYLRRLRGPSRRSPERTPPDLVIEIEITVSAVSKLPTYVALGVQEVWRYDGETLTVHRLKGTKYITSKDSKLLPGFPVADVPRWIARAQEIDDTALAFEFLAAIST